MSEPIAWLIRVTRGSVQTIMPGYMAKSAEPARAKAEAYSGKWQTCEALPVIALETVDDLSSEVSRLTLGLKAIRDAAHENRHSSEMLMSLPPQNAAAYRLREMAGRILAGMSPQ